jgi:peptide/nickel transport system permease protein
MHWQYLFRRLTLTAVTLVLVSAVTYSLIGIAPGDPAELVLQKQLGQAPTTEQIEAFRAKHGLDEPIHWQYLHWFGDLLQGDLGQSYYHERSVSELLLDRLPVTAKLAAGGLAVSLAVSLPTGILSARRPQGLADHLSQTIALLGVAMPNFWLGYLLIFAFSLKLGLTPVYGSGTLAHLVLPSITLGTGLAAVRLDCSVRRFRTRSARNSLLPRGLAVCANGSLSASTRFETHCYHYSPWSASSWDLSSTAPSSSK